MEHIQLHRSLVLDVDGSDHLHARVFTHRGWHELEASSLYDPSWQSHRAHSYAAECACGSKVWHSIPCLRARIVRSCRSKHSGVASRSRSLWMVRHPVMAWRASYRGDGRRASATDDAYALGPLGLFYRILAA